METGSEMKKSRMPFDWIIGEVGAFESLDCPLWLREDDPMWYYLSGGAPMSLQGADAISNAWDMALAEVEKEWSGADFEPPDPKSGGVGG